MQKSLATYTTRKEIVEGDNMGILEHPRQILKYPGSKWNIAPKLADLIPPHHSYLEPFFGSGALFFYKHPSNMETINDLNSDVTNLFQCIQQDAERLARLLLTIPYSRDVYEKQFEENLSYKDNFERAAGLLIRCWQSFGHRANGEKVGWKNDVQGRERMYALWNWYRLPEWVIEVCERLRMVQIENRPAIELIKRFDYENVFQYWDPPYLLETRSGKQYTHEMTDTEHEKLLNLALKSKALIMISGYESDMYNDMLHDWDKVTLKSCAEKGSPRTEVIWMNYKNPASVFLMDFLNFV